MLNRRDLFKTAIAGAAIAGATAPALAAQGRVTLRFTSAAFIIGVGGGDGALSFQGQTFPLRIGGVSAGSIGLSTGTLTGRALHLTRATDIVGTFTAVGAGVAVAGGARVFRMRNQNGVILELQGTQAGFEANIGVSGFSLSM